MQTDSVNGYVLKTLLLDVYYYFKNSIYFWKEEYNRVRNSKIILSITKKQILTAFGVTPQPVLPQV